MIRPAVLPSTVRAFISSDTVMSYVARQRVGNAMIAWGNRHGPIKMVKGPPPLRSMELIPEGDPRHDVAYFIDAIQTAFVAAVNLKNSDAGRLMSILVVQLNANPWHP